MGLGVCVDDAIVGAAVAAAVAVSAVTAVTPAVVSFSSVVVPMVVELTSVVTGGASVVGVPKDGGGPYDIPCTVGVEGGASHLCVGGSLDGVAVSSVVGWVAGGGAPGGGGGVELWPGALVGVVVVCAAEGRSMCIAACGGGGHLG